jgi:single-strand DNA-binding protein
MASDLNRVILIGRLVRDPELRYTQGGASVSSFSIANNRTYVTGGEKKEYTSFFSCVAWGKMGEVIVQYCKKGHRIGIEGRLQQRQWDDQEGKKRSTVEVVVENFQFLTPKESMGGGDAPMEMHDTTGDISNSGMADMENPFSDDDIPF